MALLTAASSTNRVVDSDLAVTYTRRRVRGEWVHVVLNVTTVHTVAWEYVRRAVKSYRYVGMTLAAATTKAEALRTLYTRTTKTSEWDGDNDEFDNVSAGDVPMADVVVQGDDDGSWSVVIAVNEEDARLDLRPNLSFATLFAIENTRTYDTD